MRVDVTQLPALPLAERAALPDVPAIYFAIARDGTVLYIGKARRLSMRWKSTIHHRYVQLLYLGDVRIAWLSVDDESLLDEIEEACIEQFDPQLNWSLVPRHPNGRVKRSYMLDRDLISRLEAVAKLELRSTVQQLEYFLEEAINEYEAGL